jgi:hypothetical protein
MQKFTNQMTVNRKNNLLISVQLKILEQLKLILHKLKTNKFKLKKKFSKNTMPCKKRKYKQHKKNKREFLEDQILKLMLKKSRKEFKIMKILAFRINFLLCN